MEGLGLSAELGQEILAILVQQKEIRQSQVTKIAFWSFVLILPNFSFSLNFGSLADDSIELMRC